MTRVSLFACALCLCAVVVTYKKQKVTADNSGRGPGGQGGYEDTEQDEELTSGQFGITDPEDEGKKDFICWSW